MDGMIIASLRFCIPTSLKELAKADPAETGFIYNVLSDGNLSRKCSEVLAVSDLFSDSVHLKCVWVAEAGRDAVELSGNRECK